MDIPPPHLSFPDVHVILALRWSLFVSSLLLFPTPCSHHQALAALQSLIPGLKESSAQLRKASSILSDAGTMEDSEVCDILC